jgi:hypothetical protein
MPNKAYKITKIDTPALYTVTYRPKSSLITNYLLLLLSITDGWTEL